MKNLGADKLGTKNITYFTVASLYTKELCEKLPSKNQSSAHFRAANDDL